MDQYPPRSWRSASASLALFLGVLLPDSYALPQAPLLELKFNETGTVAADSVRHAASYSLQGAAITATPTGPSGAAWDRAFDNTSATGMGIGHTGGGVLCGDIDDVDGLGSFTLQGWYYVQAPTQTGNNARLFDKWTGSDKGFALRAPSADRLTLTVNQTDVTSSASAHYAKQGEWVFFAVTYDGTRKIDNVAFYAGTRADRVSLVNTATLNKGAVLESTIPLIVGNVAWNGSTPGNNRPWKGLLDNLRVFGSRGGADGVLAAHQLERIRIMDTNPADQLHRPLIEHRFDETGAATPSTGSDGVGATMHNTSGAPADHHTADTGGVSGRVGDRAFATGGTAMGEGGTGGRALHDADTVSVDTLHKFTITGWYRTTHDLKNAARLVDNQSGGSGGFLLRAPHSTDGALVGENRLALRVNAGIAFSGQSFDSNDGDWVFFAVSYDGATTANNTRFYIGTRPDEVTLVNTATLNQGPVQDSPAKLAIGNSPISLDRPFAGDLDNIRIFPATLTLEELKAWRAADLSAAHLLPPAPLLEYHFNSAASSCASTGSLSIPVLSRTAGNAPTATLVTPDALAPSGQPGDRAFMNISTQSGGGYVGGAARHENDEQSLDSLTSFTLSGWFYSGGGMGDSDGRLFDKHDGASGFRLAAKQNGLALRVDSGEVVSGTHFADHLKWVFFAVSYDGGAASNNVRFYRGTLNDPVALLTTATLNQGAVNNSSARLALANAAGLATGNAYDKPFRGYLDRLRLHGATGNDAGALSREMLDVLRLGDAQGGGLQDWSLRLNDPLAVYTNGNLIEAVVAGPQVGARLSSRIVNYEGVQVWSATNVAANADSASSTRHLIEPTDPALATPGYYRLIVEVNDGTETPLATLVRPFAVIPDAAAVFSRADNAFGAMVTPHTPEPLAVKERDAQFMQRIGLRHVRTHRFNWIHGQAAATPPGGTAAYNWSDMDAEKNLYHDTYSLKIIATTGWPVPKWASSANGYGGHRSPDYFAPADAYLGQAQTFYQTLSARYGSAIAYYEVGNETDAHFWMGKLPNFKVSDSDKILEDFVDYFGAISDGIHASTSAAIIAPSGTSAVPDGHLHKDWLQRLLNHGIADSWGALSVHYDADVPAARAVLGANSQPTNLPVIVTELGGFWRGEIAPDTDIHLSTMLQRMMKDDYRDTVVQYAHGAKASCKFMLRELANYGGEGAMLAGLLDNDFTVRPTYVAYATLIRHLAGAEFVRALNLVPEVAAPAWIEAYAFNHPTEGRINVLFLNGTLGTLDVTLRSSSNNLVKVDVMGRAGTVTLPYQNGAAYSGTVTMSGRLPLIVKGTLHDHPGAPIPPAPPLPTGGSVTLVNAGFETAGSDGLPAGWMRFGGNGKLVPSRDTAIRHTGAASLKLTATEFTTYGSVAQTMTADPAWMIGEDEYLVVQVKAKVRGANIDGMGLGVAFNLRKEPPEWTVLKSQDNGLFGCNGTFAWRDFEAEMLIDYWPADASKVTLEWIFAYATGTAWVDDVELTIKKHKRTD